MKRYRLKDLPDAGRGHILAGPRRHPEQTVGRAKGACPFFFESIMAV